MKNVLALIFVSVYFFCDAFQQVSPRQSSTSYKRVEKTRTRVQEARVYVCYSKNAYAYHAYMCFGFKRCKASRGEVNISQARAMGYVPCKICY